MKPAEIALVAFALATSVFAISVGAWEIGRSVHYLIAGAAAVGIGTSALALNCRTVFKYGRLAEFRAYSARQPFVSGFRSALEMTRENVR